jgi:hypothetical protein
MNSIIILRWLNTRRWFYRWPLKVVLLFLLVLLVLFPRVDRLPKTIERYLNPNALVDPWSPALDPMIDAFEAERQPDWSKTELMNQIENFVYRKILYAWDWDLWGNAEYLPTVEEAIEMGKEDCDGRAIVAASMLRRYGFDAILVGDFRHLWVKTDIGETMSPGKKIALQYTDEGMQFDWSSVWELPDAFCYGVSVFPLWRELIIIFGAWLLLVGPAVRLRDAFLWLSLSAVGLLSMREGGDWLEPDRVMNWSGLLIIIFCIVALMVQSRRATKRFARQKGRVEMGTGQ